MLFVHEKSASEKSRLVALRISILVLRVMENLRRPFKDYESGVILVAIAAIVGERLTRTTLERDLQTLATPIPTTLLTKCNVHSIAAATGINRETTRRKVNKLIAAGLLERAEDGSIRFSPGFSQREEPSAMIRAQLETVIRTVNELVREGVVTSSD
jgi:predicted transcriptional regulator